MSAAATTPAIEPALLSERREVKLFAVVRGEIVEKYFFTFEHARLYADTFNRIVQKSVGDLGPMEIVEQTAILEPFEEDGTD